MEANKSDFSTVIKELSQAENENEVIERGFTALGYLGYTESQMHDEITHVPLSNIRPTHHLEIKSESDASVYMTVEFGCYMGELDDMHAYPGHRGSGAAEKRRQLQQTMEITDAELCVSISNDHLSVWDGEDYFDTGVPIDDPGRFFNVLEKPSSLT